jgi:hypothetical protein
MPSGLSPPLPDPIPLTKIHATVVAGRPRGDRPYKRLKKLLTVAIIFKIGIRNRNPSDKNPVSKLIDDLQSYFS